MTLREHGPNPYPPGTFLAAQWESSRAQRDLDGVEFDDDGAPTNLDDRLTAAGDALYRSREGRPEGWWIRHDSDDEWTVLSAEVLRVKGPAMTTVRLWWREPTI